jgi:hypothetical protein
MSICLQRYRAVQRKVRRKAEAERDTELARILKVAHNANRAAYAGFRKSRLNQEAVEMILDACHVRRQAAAGYFLPSASIDCF